MAILLDSSFIIAFDNEDDVHHKTAIELWKNIEKLKFGQYFISDYLFDEIIAVSLRKTNKDDTIKLGEKIMKSPSMFHIDNHIFNKTWKIFKKINLNLSFTDCTNLFLMDLTGSKYIATFDKEFKKVKEIEVID